MSEGTAVLTERRQLGTDLASTFLVRPTPRRIVLKWCGPQSGMKNIVCSLVVLLLAVAVIEIEFNLSSRTELLQAWIASASRRIPSFSRTRPVTLTGVVMGDGCGIMSEPDGAVRLVAPEAKSGIQLRHEDRVRWRTSAFSELIIRSERAVELKGVADVDVTGQEDWYVVHCEGIAVHSRDARFHIQDNSPSYVMVFRGKVLVQGYGWSRWVGEQHYLVHSRGSHPAGPELWGTSPPHRDPLGD